MNDGDDHSALLAAAEAGDDARQLLLYRRAGERQLAAGETDPGCFYLTQAWVFALATGDGEAEREICELLRAHGRL